MRARVRRLHHGLHVPGAVERRAGRRRAEVRHGQRHRLRQGTRATAAIRPTAGRAAAAPAVEGEGDSNYNSLFSSYPIPASFFVAPFPPLPRLATSSRAAAAAAPKGGGFELWLCSSSNGPHAHLRRFPPLLLPCSSRPPASRTVNPPVQAYSLAAVAATGAAVRGGAGGVAAGAGGGDGDGGARPAARVRPVAHPQRPAAPRPRLRPPGTPPPPPSHTHTP